MKIKMDIRSNSQSYVDWETLKKFMIHLSKLDQNNSYELTFPWGISLVTNKTLNSTSKAPSKLSHDCAKIEEINGAQA